MANLSIIETLDQVKNSPAVELVLRGHGSEITALCLYKRFGAIEGVPCTKFCHIATFKKQKIAVYYSPKQDSTEVTKQKKEWWKSKRHRECKHAETRILHCPSKNFTTWKS